MGGALGYGPDSTTGILPRGLINGSASTITHANYGSALNAAATGIATTGQTKIVLSGTQVAGVLAPVLSLSGKGAIGFLACANADATSRTHRLKVTIDSIVVWDATSPASVSMNNWLFAIGCALPFGAAQAQVIPDYLQFNKSLLVEYASSLSETGQTVLAYKYIPR